MHAVYYSIFYSKVFTEHVYYLPCSRTDPEDLSLDRFLHGDAVADVAPHLSSSIFYSDQFIKVLRYRFFHFLIFSLFKRGNFLSFPDHEH